MLVVDDAAELRRLMVMVLTRAGIRADDAADGGAALARARENPPHVVVCDRMLPGMDGLEICRRLREEHGCRTILVSGAPLPPGMAERVDLYLQKPVPPAVLVEHVRALASAPPSP